MFGRIIRRCVECMLPIRESDLTGYCETCWPRVTTREVLKSVGFDPVRSDGLVTRCFVCEEVRLVRDCHTLLTAAATFNLCREGACMRAFVDAVDAMHTVYVKERKPVHASIFREVRAKALS